MTDQERTTYASSGVNYELMDPVKRLAQEAARSTSGNLARLGINEIPQSRGESAHVIELPDFHLASVIEGLGTKALVADKVRELTGKTYHRELAQDTVAMILNDLITVGADPLVINAYFGAGAPDWFEDLERAGDLIDGWKDAANLSLSIYGGGETPTLKGVIYPEAVELVGSAYGIIKPKERLTLGDKLTEGDSIFLVESSGIHANGLTLARSIADKHPHGYGAILSDGKSYGESLLVPTHIYAGLVRDLFDAGVDIHYMANITGHGWRKLMRATQEFTYVIDQVPTVHPVFDFIQEQSGNDDEEMYGNFNMGVGFAIFMPEEFVETAQRIAMESYGLKSGTAGYIEEGPKKVIVNPNDLTFEGYSLAVR